MQILQVKDPAEAQSIAVEQPIAVAAVPATPPPAVEPPAAPAPSQGQPGSKDAASCCGVQPGQSRYRTWLIGAAALGVPLALFGGWDWLVATGLATMLVALAPCLVMCALGLCMARGGKTNAQPSLADIRKTYETDRGEPPRG